MKNEIRIEFSIGPREEDQEIVGSYHFITEKSDEAFIVNALKKSISKLEITKEQFIVGLFDVFINNIKSYEVGLFGIGKMIKSEIRKL
jgi:hypothetical protein